MRRPKPLTDNGIIISTSKADKLMKLIRSSCNRRTGNFFLAFVVFGISIFTSQSQAQVRIALTSFSADFAGLYTAQHLGLFAKEGVQVEPILISSSAVNIPSLLAKEIDLLMSAGEAGLRVYHGGYKNIRIIDKFTFTLMVRPGINTPADLLSQTIAVTRFGGSLDTSLRMR
jgi:ABC-type nitrate/sulfonate/bicarbonate transport system substrate-binding protein